MNERPEALRDVLLLVEAAEYLGLHPQTLRYHLHVSGLLVGVKKGNRWLFLRSQLDVFKARVRVGGRRPNGCAESEMLDPPTRLKQAARLRDREGRTLSQIAKALGYGSASSTSRAVKRGRELLRRERKRKRVKP